MEAPFAVAPVVRAATAVRKVRTMAALEEAGWVARLVVAVAREVIPAVLDKSELTEQPV